MGIYSLASSGVFRDEKLAPARVLLVDIDNPPGLIRYRLKHICESTDIEFRIMTRDHAPKLMDRKAWESLPAEDYDVIILDSFGGATPGVGEKDAGPLQKALDTLRMIADKGPAVIVLENTNKSALSYRGRGEKTERVDVFYELRDATGFTPSSGEYWWKDLPSGSDEEYRERANRKNAQQKMRLAWMCRKFRWGEEPAPFCVEVDFTTTPWSLRDVTEEIQSSEEHAAKEEKEAHQRPMQDAAYALKKKLCERTDTEPMGKTEAVDFLYAQGLTRKVARAVLESHNANTYSDAGLWRLDTIPNSKNKVGVFPLTNIGGKLADIPNSNKNNGQNTLYVCRTDDTGAANIPPLQRVENTKLAEPGMFAAEPGLKNSAGAANIPQAPAREPCEWCGRLKEGARAEAFCLECDTGYEVTDLTGSPKADDDTDELRI